MLKTLFFAIVLLTAALVGAQTKLDAFDSHCANILLLQQAPVKKELGVTEGQRAQMNSFAAWHQQELVKIDTDVRAKKISATDPKLRPRIDALFGQLKSKVLGVLTPKQLHRLAEVSLQNVGDAALCDPVVAKKIGMTEPQIKKMQSTYQEGAKKFASLEQTTAQAVLAPYQNRKPKDEAEAKKWNAEVQTKMEAASRQVKPKLDAVRASYKAKMQAILTAKQKKAYQGLLGKTLKG